MGAVRRESREAFWSRVEQEGRRAEAEAVWRKLLGDGLSKRQAQVELVARFQPLDGSETEAWRTPDSWARGRRDAKKPPPDSQEQLERDVQWVHDNPEKSPEEAPTTGAKLFLLMAKERPGEFLKVYLKCVPDIAKRQQEQLKASRQRVVKRRDAARRRRQADRRAGYREQERRRKEQAAAEEEARRQTEVRKQERVRLLHEREQAARRPKRVTKRQQPKLAVSANAGDDWEVL